MTDEPHNVQQPAGELRQELTSWKEIAHFLRVAERTAQEWEKSRALPVKRHPGQRGRVFAYSDELNQWKVRIATSKRSTASGEDTVWWRFVRNRARVATLCAAVAMVAIGSGWYFLAARSNPVSATIVNGALLALDRDGKTLWSRRFNSGFPLEFPSGRTIWQIVDLNHDGFNEVLAPQPPDDPKRVGSWEQLVCFDRLGNIRWSFKPGAHLRWGGTDFANYFQLWTYSTHDFDHSGNQYTTVIANHVPLSPAHVAILDSNGLKIGEYWHTGYLFDFDYFDVDGDGTDEIVAGGINNILGGKACLVAFNYKINHSISPVPAGYAPSLHTQNEILYITFPQTDVAASLAADSRVRVVRHEGDLLQVAVEIRHVATTEERLYHLDRNFKVVRLNFPQSFIALHHQLYQDGKLDHELGDSEKEALKRLEFVVGK